MRDRKSAETDIQTLGKGKIQEICVDGVTRTREGAEQKSTLRWVSTSYENYRSNRQKRARNIFGTLNHPLTNG